MRAEVERLLDGAFRKIVRGVVTGNRAAIVGELRVAELIDLAGRCASADARQSSTNHDNRGAVGALDERAGVCSDGPWGPLARFVRGGFSASVSGVDRRTARDVLPGVQVALV